MKDWKLTIEKYFLYKDIWMPYRNVYGSILWQQGSEIGLSCLYSFRFTSPGKTILKEEI
jgi:hypothetical protein